MQTKKNSSARHIYTVSQITQDIKLILENNFNDVWVEGEVSGFTRTPKGIMFFSLKDSGSLLKCVMFNSSAVNVKFEIKDGMNLICYGKVSVYEKDGKYQLYAQQVEPKGIGSLQLALEQLKEKLEKEGLFAVEHKRPIPYLPSKIGVVTSLSGAAIKDILKVLDRRFADVQIIINPAQVQGEAAKDDISRAIKDFNLFNETLPGRERIEVMIVGRGGGSIEDLWAFNEEIVARAIYNSQIPVISAVGHERDWTIADLVADLRAPTPSVAAELVIPKKEDLKERLDGLSGGLKRSFLDALRNFQEAVDDFNHRLSLSAQNLLKLSASEFAACRKRLILLNPVVMIQQYKEKMRDLARQIYVRMQHFMELRRAALTSDVEKLSGLSPLNILNRGYSITFKLPDGAVIKDTGFVKKGDTIKTRLHKGEILSQVMEVRKNG
ncbi:MAG: exodeoxyribonuclease VII large subunit [Candidatus Omnitrophota bacterium]